jgi:F-type H+-transporting ATPase subunit delta
MVLSKNLKNFLLLIVKKRRIFFIDNIIKRFLELVSKKKGKVKASLVSSKQLLENEILDISNEISKSIKSQVELKYSIDKSLISGIKLQVIS